jgi:isoquinoline 1-oxidoreductase beta subunit
VGHSFTAFVVETLMDEAAQKVGMDPFAFRQLHLKGETRHLAVLDKLREQSAWDKPLPSGQFRGMALHKSFGTICGQVVEISYEAASGQFKVLRVVAVVDCGQVVQPNIVEAQVSGGIVFALSAALWGKISLREGAVVETNFHNYPIARISDCPAIEVQVMSNGETPSGIGEPGVPPLAPALANALTAATQKRYRSLPLLTT